MAMVDVDGRSLQADSQPQSLDLSGLGVGGQLVLSLRSLNEPGELL